MIPVLEALRTLSIANDDVADAVRISGGDYHIYGPQRTMPQYKPVPPKSVVLGQAGGRPEPTVPIGRQRIRVRCYGKDAAEAGDLYRLLATVFYDATGRTRGSQKVGTYLMFWAELSEPSIDIEAVSGWPVASGLLESEWATIPVA